MPKGRIKGTYKHSKETKIKIGAGLVTAYKEGKRNKFLEEQKERMRLQNFGKFGKNHPCYKENKKHLFHKIIRETFKYRQWRSDIFTRDNFTCILCGNKNIYLEVDHYPKRFIDILKENNIKTLEEALNCEELWNINNGRTLCNKCHLQTDTWGRKKED